MSREDKRDEHLPTGAIVYWSRMYGRGGRHYNVPVWCPDCKRERIADVNTATRDGFTGLCTRCWDLRQSAATRHQYPTADERLDNGCVNHWSEIFTDADGKLKVPVTCADCGRKRPVQAKYTREASYTGLCTGCAGRHRGRGADPGTKRKTKKGYVEVKLARDHPYYGMADRYYGWVLEHRLVMAQSLGRPLESHETVHHRNGRRDDNRLENLELWQRGHPIGQRVADLENLGDKVLIRLVRSRLFQ